MTREPLPGYNCFLAGRYALPSFTSFILPGDYCEEATPVPIPNTEVKLFNADGTALRWESRSSPGFLFLFCCNPNLTNNVEMS